MQKPKTWDIVTIGGLFLVVAAGAAMINGVYVSWTPDKIAAARQELCAVDKLFPLGGSYNRGLEVFERSVHKHVTILQKSPKFAVFRTPIELPGLTTQWQLLVISNPDTGDVMSKEISEINGKHHSCSEL